MGRAVLALLLLALPVFSFAQPKPQPVTLAVTVVDTSGAVLPGAAVTVTGLDPANSKAGIDPAKAGADGVATLTNLVPGRYSVEAVFEGFETRRLAEIRVRA